MPRSLTVTLLLATGLAMSTPACSRFKDHDPVGSGRQDARDWAALKGFSAIEVTGPDNVDVKIGPAFSVKAEGDAKIIERMDIHVEGGTLSVGRKQNSGSFWGSDSGEVTVHVTLPAVSALTLTGSGNLDVDRAEGKALAIDLTGSGDLIVGAVKTASLKSDITGSGNVKLAGIADEGRFSITGSGDVVADALKVGKGDVEVLGSGNVGFASDGPVAINIMGSGDVTVKGKAQCSSNAMGSGEVHCGS